MIRNRELQHAFLELSERLHRVETALLIQEPGSVRSGEVFDGLRKAVITAARDRQVHLAHLAQLNALARNTDDIHMIQSKLAEQMSEAGLSRVDRIEDAPNAFDLDGTGDRITVRTPAYVLADPYLEVVRGHAVRSNGGGQRKVVQSSAQEEQI